MSMSAATPTAGFAASPDVASDPPHSTARVSSETGKGSRFSSATSWAIPCSILTPFSVVLRVPPSSWMTRVSTGFPLGLIPSASISAVRVSQPSPTMRTPATLGFLPVPTRAFTSMESLPQPWYWVTATAPSTWAAIFFAGS